MLLEDGRNIVYSKSSVKLDNGVAVIRDEVGAPVAVYNLSRIVGISVENTTPVEKMEPNQNPKIEVPEPKDAA